MNPEIRSRFDELENRRMALVARVRRLAPGVQTARPTSKEFSPVEVLMHMALAEQFDLDELEKTPPEALVKYPPKPTFIFPRVIQTLSSGRKVGTFKSMTPTPGATLETASAEWERVRGELADRFDKVSDPNAVMIKLFLFGRLSAMDFLKLLDAHTSYHELRFPTAD